MLILSFDAKGIVMRPNSVRLATKKAAQAQSHKLQTRLSQGEKRNRKRMTQVATLYTVKHHVRAAESIIQRTQDANIAYLQLGVINKSIWASVKRDSETVTLEAFQEALQRDPKQSRQWVILVDGHPHQIKMIKRIMRRL